MAKKNNVAVAVADAVGADFESMMDDVQDNVIRIHSHLMSLFEGNDAQGFTKCLKALREKGGMCKSLAGHERTFFVAFGGYTSANGDTPAKFAKKRSPETIKEYRDMDPCKAYAQLVTSKLSLFEAPKKSSKEKDAKAEALKTIGGWDSSLILWVLSHKETIEGAVKKENDSKKA